MHETSDFNLCRKVFLILGILCLICYMVVFQAPHSLKGKGSEGNPYKFTKNRWYSERITGFSVRDNYIYLLFDKKGVVKCYQTDGTYMHSYYFNLPNNGRMGFLSTNDSLYVEDRWGNIYGMENAEITEFLHWERDAEAIREIREKSNDIEKTNYDADGAEYTRKGRCIVRIANGQEKTIIKIPFWSYIFSPILLWFTLVICIALYALTKMVARKI